MKVFVERLAECVFRHECVNWQRRVDMPGESVRPQQSHRCCFAQQLKRSVCASLLLCLTPSVTPFLPGRKGGSRGRATLTVIAPMFQHTTVVRQRFENKGKRAFCFLLATLLSAGGPPPLVPRSSVCSFEKKQLLFVSFCPRGTTVTAENKSRRI